MRWRSRYDVVLDVGGAGAVAFLGILLVGVVFVLALKLQSPDFGSGSNPVEILTAIVIFALASLGAPVHIGDLSLAALPLGALLAEGVAIAGAAAHLADRRSAASIRERALEGAKIAIPFAAMATVAALAFRFRGRIEISVVWGGALGAALLWGAIFGALGGISAPSGLRSLVDVARRALAKRADAVRSGCLSGLTMLGAPFVLAAAAGLVLLIIRLATGGPVRGFDVGDALAGLIFVIAFLPNILVAIVAVSLGAPIEAGARVTLEGRVVGPLREFSLFDWPGGDAPGYVFLALAIPLVACFVGGLVARHSSSGRRPWPTVGIAAVVFATALGVLSLLAEARLGGGLVSDRGFGRVAPQAPEVFVFALAWALVVGAIGYKVADLRSGRAWPDRRTDMSSEEP